ncbi:MAG: MTAP family purine nucleoside phosphorylase [bacterium]
MIVEIVETETPYGKPSAPIIVGELCGGHIAFLPRHGSKHTIPPHKVPYKANLAALKSLGVRHVIGTCVAGSLRKEIYPGAFMVPDQFINLTWGRDDTFEIDQELVHLPMARPYCEHIRKIVARELKMMNMVCHDKGTAVVIQGPRFSTIAESKMFALWGGDVVNMTQYPECYFARELGLCYGAVASVTDYDVGVLSTVSMQPESMDKVLTIFHRNTAMTVLLIGKLVELVSEIIGCNCAAHRIAEYYKLAKGENP